MIMKKYLNNASTVINSSVLLLMFSLVLQALPVNRLYAEEEETLHFGYSSSQNPAILIDRMTPLMKIMSDELNVNIEFVHKKTFAEMQKAYINQEIDIGIINAFSFLRILPYDSVIPIAARVIENSKKYQTYFFARKGSDIISMDKLRGKVVALGDPYSTSSYLIPHHIFRAYCIIPEVDFSETVIISKQDSLILSVLNRTADAGVAASFIFNEQSEEIKSGLHVFEKSVFFPLGPFIVNKNLDPRMIENIKEILFSLTETERGRKALDRAEIEGFETVNIDDYNGLKEIMETMNIN